MNFPDKNTGVGYPFFLQGTFLTQGLNLLHPNSRSALLTSRVSSGFHILRSLSFLCSQPLGPHCMFQQPSCLTGQALPLRFNPDVKDL